MYTNCYKKVNKLKFINLMLVLFSLQLNGQEMSNIIRNREPGKVYYKALIQPFDTPFSLHQQLYRLSPPVFETSLDTIFYDQFKDKKKIRVIINEAHNEWIVKEEGAILQCIYPMHKHFVAVGIVEKKPPVWETIKIDPKKNFEIIEVEKVKTKSRFDRIDHVENELFLPDGKDYITWVDGQNKYIKTATGGWTVWRELLCGSHYGNTYSIKQIKEKLKEKGYFFGPINNELDKETKAALTKFMQDNNLPTHVISFELLKILEIKY